MGRADGRIRLKSKRPRVEYLGTLGGRVVPIWNGISGSVKFYSELQGKYPERKKLCRKG